MGARFSQRRSERQSAPLSVASEDGRHAEAQLDAGKARFRHGQSRAGGAAKRRLDERRPRPRFRRKVRESGALDERRRRCLRTSAAPERRFHERRRRARARGRGPLGVPGGIGLPSIGGGPGMPGVGSHGSSASPRGAPESIPASPAKAQPSSPSADSSCRWRSPPPASAVPRFPSAAATRPGRMASRRWAFP